MKSTSTVLAGSARVESRDSIDCAVRFDGQRGRIFCTSKAH